MPAAMDLVPADPIPAAAGIGLRFAHHRAVLGEKPAVSWFEVHAENYFRGVPLAFLDAIRRDYPMSLHGVGLSLGGAEGLDRDHLAKLRALADRIEPGLISEHLSWSGNAAQYLADLLPLPLTEEALDIFCRNVDALQAALGRRVLVENPSTYLQFAHSTMPEAEFLVEVVRRTGCGLLCDVNNIFVSARNHGFDAVFIDLYFVNQLVRPGGVIIFDDANWDGVFLASRFAEMEYGYRVFDQLGASSPRDAPMRAYRKPESQPLRRTITVAPFFEGFTPRSENVKAAMANKARHRGLVALARGKRQLARRYLRVAERLDPLHLKTWFRRARTSLPMSMIRATSGRPRS